MAIELKITDIEFTSTRELEAVSAFLLSLRSTSVVAAPAKKPWDDSDIDGSTDDTEAFDDTRDVATDGDNTITGPKYPWDARIHSSSKARNKDGSFKYVRGVDKALIDIIKAEHDRLMLIPVLSVGVTEVIAPPAPPVDTATVELVTNVLTGLGHPTVIAPPAPPVEVAAPPVEVAAPPAPPAPPVEVAVAAPPAPTGPIGYFDYIKLVTNAITSGLVTQEHVQATLIANGISVQGQLAARADLIPQVLAGLGL
jgi:hypothetical protein